MNLLPPIFLSRYLIMGHLVPTYHCHHQQPSSLCWNPVLPLRFPGVLLGMAYSLTFPDHPTSDSMVFPSVVELLGEPAFPARQRLLKVPQSLPRPHLPASPHFQHLTLLSTSQRKFKPLTAGYYHSLPHAAVFPSIVPADVLKEVILLLFRVILSTSMVDPVPFLLLSFIYNQPYLSGCPVII